jgi:hypothetical protein
MNRIPSFTVKMALRDILYLTYLLPESRIRRLVPENIIFSSHFKDQVFLSVVIFTSHNVRIAGIPVSSAYNQINVRTYVIDPLTKEPAVLFLRSGVSSRMTATLTHFIGVPWEYADLSLVAQSSERFGYERYEALGTWGAGGRVSVVIAEDTVVPTHCDGIENYRRASQFLTGPAVGLFSRRGRLLRFEVKHSEIMPHSGRVLRAELDLLTESGLLNRVDLSTPYNVLLARNAEFTVFMPPEELKI